MNFNHNFGGSNNNNGANNRQDPFNPQFPGFNFNNPNDLFSMDINQLMNMNRFPNMNFPQIPNLNMNMNMNMDPFQNQGGSNYSYSVKSFSTSSSNSNGGPTTYTTQTHSSSVKYDGSGNEPHQEFFENKTAGVIGAGGQKLEETQSKYKNTSSGQYKAMHQRIMNDQEIKKVNEKNIKTGDETEDTEYNGLEENDEQRFHQQFNNIRNNYHMNPQLGNLNANNNPQNYKPQQFYLPENYK